MHDDSVARTTRWLTRLWLAWFVLYMVTGAVATQRHRTSFLAATVEKVESRWLALVFLNLPLQIVIILVALLCASSASGVASRVALMLAWTATGLVLGHVALSILHA